MGRKPGRTMGSVRSFKRVRERNTNFSDVLDIFTDESVSVTAKGAWELYGGNYDSVRIALGRYYEEGILMKSGDGRGSTYRLTTDNDVVKMLEDQLFDVDYSSPC